MLATCLLNNAFILGSSGSKENTHDPEFRWVLVRYNAFRLIWDVNRLVKLNVTTIRAVAFPLLHTGPTVNKTVSVESGRVLLDRLRPETLYQLDVGGYQEKVNLFSYHTSIKTWPTGKFFQLICTAISKTHFVLERKLAQVEE